MALARDPAKAQAWQERSAKRAADKRRAAPKPAALKRSKPIASKRAAKPTAPAPKSRSPKPAKKRTPLPKRNQPRLTKLRLAQFGTPEQTRMINAMPCMCGRTPRPHPECTGGWSEPSHIVTRGAGGMKEDQVAHSTGCHTAFHAHGIDTYCEVVGITREELRAEADRTWAAVSGMDGSAGWSAPA